LPQKQALPQANQSFAEAIREKLRREIAGVFIA
jgi:hypothetical protein